MAVDRSNLPGWVAPYIGLPFRLHGRDRSGVDCWGLVRLVLMEQFGLDLPAYTAGYERASPADRADIARLIEGRRSDWIAVDPAATRAGDVLLIRLWGYPSHVAVAIAPGWMLHVEEGRAAIAEIHDGPVWRHRIAGVYRHAELA